MKYLFFVLLALNLVSCSNLKTKNYSEKDDQYWANLVGESMMTKKSILQVIETKNPALLVQIQNDSKDSVLLSFWGQSLNFDSGAKKQIVDDFLMSELQAQFGIKNDNKIVHAGITHTYGYLFSVLQTPYGFKRQRWIAPTLNYAFSFDGLALSPETIDGGLLSNITYFAGMLAFKNETDKKNLTNLKNVSKEILNFDYPKISVDVLEEQIGKKDDLGPILRTSLLRLPFKKSGEENDYLLIYSVLNPKNQKEVLITAFPIKKEAYKTITSEESFGANQPIIIRYNTYLEGLMEQKLTGVRKFLKDSVKN
jgi:hypothetical protein